MKLKMILKTLAALVLLTFASLLPCTAGLLGKFNLQDVISDLASRLGHAKFKKYLDDAVIVAQQRIETAGSRWHGRTEVDVDGNVIEISPQMAARAELDAALGSAELASRAAGATSGSLRDETIQAMARAFTSERVSLTNRTNLNDAGEGVGHMVREIRTSTPNSELADVEADRLAAEVLDHVTTRGLTTSHIFGPPVPPPSPSGLNISVAEFADAIRVLREGGVPIPKEYWTTGKLLNTGNDPGGGPIAELLIAARDKRAGKNVTGLEIDTTNPAYQDTAIDYITDTEFAQVGLTLNTIENKLSKAVTGGVSGSKLAAQIKRAHAIDPSKKFVFKYLDPNGTLPSSTLINDVNAQLALLYPGGGAPSISIANFFPIQTIP